MCSCIRNQELENELMAVIMTMESQVAHQDDMPAAHSSTIYENLQPQSSFSLRSLAAGPMGSAAAANDEERKEEQEEETAPHDSPILFKKARPRTLRAAAPAAPPAHGGVTRVAGQMLGEQTADDAECPSPLDQLSCSSESEDVVEQGGLFPLALEAALNAVVDEGDAPWNAAVSAAVAAAQDDDSEAWHVALEAALEVATAHAVASQATLFRERIASTKSPPPDATHMSCLTAGAGCRSAQSEDGTLQLAPAPQSLPDSENVGPEEALPPVCIPMGAVLGSDFLRDDGTGLQAGGHDASMMSLIDASIIDKNDLSQDLVCYSRTHSPCSLTQQLHALPPNAQHGTQNALHKPLRQDIWSPPPGAAWISALSGSATDTDTEAGEAACRSIEAEIIRRCILDLSPFDSRKIRTPTDASHTHTLIPTTSESATRRVPIQGATHGCQQQEVLPPVYNEGRASNDVLPPPSETMPAFQKRAVVRAVRCAPPPPAPSLEKLSPEQPLHAGQEQPLCAGSCAAPSDAVHAIDKQPVLRAVRAPRTPPPPAHSAHIEHLSAPPQHVALQQRQDKHVYTAADLDEVEIRPVAKVSQTSPSELHSHLGNHDPLLGWHVSSPSPRAPPLRIPSCSMPHSILSSFASLSSPTADGIAPSAATLSTTHTDAHASHQHPARIASETQKLQPFGNTSPTSPLKKPKPASSSTEKSAPRQPQPKAPATVESEPMDLTSWISGSLMSMGNGAFGMIATRSTPSQHATPSVAASSSSLPSTSEHAPLLSFRGTAQPTATHTPLHTDVPSPRVSCLLPSARTATRPISSRGEMTRGPAALDQRSAATPHVSTFFGNTHDIEDAQELGLSPLRGQLFLDGEELIVPDPALGLLNCACTRTVSVCPPWPADKSARVAGFVDVCIDCGAVHPRASCES